MVKSVGVKFPLFLDQLKRSFTVSPIQDYKKTTNKRTMERNEFSSNNLVSQGGMSGKSHSGSDESLNGGTDSVKSSKVPSRIIWMSWTCCLMKCNCNVRTIVAEGESSLFFNSKCDASEWMNKLVELRQLHDVFRAFLADFRDRITRDLRTERRTDEPSSRDA